MRWQLFILGAVRSLAVTGHDGQLQGILWLGDLIADLMKGAAASDKGLQG